MDRAEQISIGPWRIYARRGADGRLAIEVLLGDAPHTKIELDEGTAPESRRAELERQAKLEADIDY